MNFIRVAFQKKVCLVLVSKDFFSPLFYFFWRLLFLWVELNASVLDVCCVCFFNCSVYIRHWPGKKNFPPKHRFLCFRNEKRTIAFGGIWASSLWNKRNYFRPFWYFELYHGKGIGNILGLLFNVIFTACWRWCWWLKRNVSCNWIINETLYYNIFVLIRIHFTVVYFFFLSFV